jgi:hypothetical protein
LLERHLQGRREARGDDAAELTAFGIAYLEWLPGRMLRRVEAITRRVAENASLDWTISFLVSAVVVAVRRSNFD